MTPTLAARTPDAVLAAAVDDARRALADDAVTGVGAHTGVSVDGERLVTHTFAAEQPGYPGWQWSVTLARAPRSKHVTVCEIVLLPGPSAVLAPPWLPWSQRLAPGDLGVGDLLPAPPDDDRLVPAYVQSDDPEVEAVATEIGLGRERVLSQIGRDDASDRWYDGDRGPSAPIAQAAPGRCGTCGFYLPLAGAMRPLFGVCANAYAPDDARVVSADHGCGAHSQAVPEPPTSLGERDALVLDDTELDVSEREPVAVEPT